MRILTSIQRSKFGGLLLAATVLGLPLATTSPAGAHIIPVADMIRGITITQAQCAAIPQTIWLNVMGRDFCVRYYLSTAGGSNAWPAVFLQGDRLGTLKRDGTWSPGAKEKDIDTDNLMKFADSLSKQTGTTAIYLGRIGVEGTSGDHRDRKTVLELNLMHAALDALKQRHSFKGFHLIGQSGGSKLVGGLTALRQDVGCAVIGAGRLSNAPDRPPSQNPSPQAFNVVDAIPAILQRRSTRILVITDPEDKKVPERTQTDFVRKFQQAGGHIEQYIVEATDDNRHGITPYARAAAADCMRNVSPKELAQNLQHLVQKRLAAKAARANAAPSVAPNQATPQVAPATLQSAPYTRTDAAPAVRTGSDTQPAQQTAMSERDRNGMGAGGSEVPRSNVQ